MKCMAGENKVGHGAPPHRHPKNAERTFHLRYLCCPSVPILIFLKFFVERTRPDDPTRCVAANPPIIFCRSP
jgi:hypothetical protein